MPMGQRISEQSWQEHRKEIEALYIEEDQTLEEVMAEMKERHGFVARSNTPLIDRDFTNKL